MIMYFDGKFSGNAEEFGHPFINAIDFINKRTGNIITLDRDETAISWEDDGTFSARWKGCYIWDGHGRNYDVCASDMEEYELYEINYEEDSADEDDIPDYSTIEITGYKFV